MKKKEKRKQKERTHTTKETDLCNFIIKAIKEENEIFEQRFCCFFSFDEQVKRMIEREKKESLVYL